MSPKQQIDTTITENGGKEMNDIYQAIDDLAQNASRLERQKIIDQLWAIREMIDEQQAEELAAMIDKISRDSIQY